MRKPLETSVALGRGFTDQDLSDERGIKEGLTRFVRSRYPKRYTAMSNGRRRRSN
jgi:hypothetical protein